MIQEQSLIIKDVELRDAGLYTCSITTFPSGSFQGVSELIVKGEFFLFRFLHLISIFTLTSWL